MKIAVQKIVIVVLILLSGETCFAQTPPPPSPSPGLPVDGGLVVMFFATLILGYLFSKRYIFSKKSS